MRSKVILILSLLFLFFSLPLAKSQIGFRAGIGITDIAFLSEGQIPYLGYEAYDLLHRLPLITFQAGIFGTIGLSKKLDFQPELLFVRQGSDYDTKFLYDDIIYKIKIDYLQLPLLLRYKVGKKKQSGFFIGPYTSLKLNAFRVTEIEGIRERSAVSNVKTIDFGGIVGFSMDIDLPSGNLVVDFRTGYSLINMMDTVDGYIPWYLGPKKAYARNVSIALTVGYKFSDLWSNKAKRE